MSRFPFAVIVISFVFFAIMTLAIGYDKGYREGQEDALKNHYEYQRIEAADGEVRYIHLSKPTTMPVK